MLLEDEFQHKCDTLAKSFGVDPSELEDKVDQAVEVFYYFLRGMCLNGDDTEDLAELVKIQLDIDNGNR